MLYQGIAINNQDSCILKTKYSRRINGKVESFTSYVVSVNGGCNKRGGFEYHYPKNTTLASLKRANPEFSELQVVVMPSITLKGIAFAKCEEHKGVIVRSFGFVTKPADVTIETASEEEQAEDLITEPTDTIYTLESERPNPIIMGFKAAEQIARSIPAGHYRRATVQGVVVNYYGYKERNGRMWVVGDTPDDLPSADVKIELSGEWLPAYEIF